MLLFFCILCIAVLNLPQNNLVIHLWIVIVSIVCPLMSHFIPSIFYFKVSRQQEDDKDEGKKKRSFYRFLAVVYIIIGALFLPLFLTLATKALFTSASSYACTSAGCGSFA